MRVLFHIKRVLRKIKYELKRVKFTKLDKAILVLIHTSFFGVSAYSYYYMYVVM